MQKITEANSNYRHLEQMSVGEVLHNINQEDKGVPMAVGKALPAIEALVKVVVNKMKGGGRLFYLGAGTSGRLGILDASECPPTYGVPADWVIGLIAGGETAIRNAVEFAEDSQEQAWQDLQEHFINQQDVVIGIAASGTTPYVVHGLKTCQEQDITTGCITCNPGAPIAEYADYPVEVIVGPEFVTGSTRMKAGTAQKLVLNMISTTAMIQLGRVLDNKMVDMKLSNTKLVERGTKILVNALKISPEKAREQLLKHGSVRGAMDAFQATGKGE